MIFRCQQLDRAHANTYWRKTFLLSGVWKKIFRCQQYANVLWEKPYCCQKWGKHFPSPATSTGTCEHTLEKNLFVARRVAKDFLIPAP